MDLNQFTPEVKLPPHSVEAEQAVLGALLVNNDNFDRVADRLNQSMFFRQEHRIIYEQIAKQLMMGHSVDAITLYEQLLNINKAQDCGGLEYLTALTHSVSSPGHVLHYVEIVRDKSLLRHLLNVTEDIAQSAFHTAGRSPTQILDEAESKIFSISEQSVRSNAGFQSLREVLPSVHERIKELNKSGGDEITGLPFGYADLDRMTSGMHAGDLIVVAGRPSMGKTSFAVNIAEYVSITGKMPVALFSMEMGAAQITQRILGSVSRVEQTRLRTGKLHHEDWPKINKAIEELAKVQFFIDETPALNPLELRARARRLVRLCAGKIGLIVVDYLQLMSSSREGENRATEISEISRSLKALARELGCPVIALSQLNRDLEKRVNKRPVMSDLRESGAIEQDADIILFIYREHVYSKKPEDQGLAEVEIAKQRNGPTGTIKFTFLPELTRFENHHAA